MRQLTLKSDPTPGSLCLLPGYYHRREMGLDTLVGKIWRPGGMVLQYDIGALAGNHAQNTKKRGSFVWYREQSFGLRKAQLVLQKDRTLFVTFLDDTANFYGKARTEEDLLDALLMLATYAPSS